jgi:hypothetical protein
MLFRIACVAKQKTVRAKRKAFKGETMDLHSETKGFEIPRRMGAALVTPYVSVFK